MTNIQRNYPRTEIGNIFPSHDNMTAIVSGKGGVGKTWFAVTLAHALSYLKNKILFFDGDLGLSNIDNQLGLGISHDIGCAVTGVITLNQIITNSDKGHFDVIAGRAGSAKLTSMPVGRLQILAEDLLLLSPNYDQVLLDMDNGNDRSVRILAGKSGKIIVVCTDEPSSLTEAYGIIKAMSSQYPQSCIFVVVNQAETIQAGQITYEILRKACHSYLDITPPLLGIVRRDARVRDAIRNQMPIITRYPTSEAAKDVMEIARKLQQ